MHPGLIPRRTGPEPRVPTRAGASGVVYHLYLLCFSLFTGPADARIPAGGRCEAVELRGPNDARVDAYLDDAQDRFGASELVLDTIAKVVW